MASESKVETEQKRGKKPGADKTTTYGVREYNSKNADAETLRDKSAAAIGSLGLGKSLSVPDMSHVEG